MVIIFGRRIWLHCMVVRYGHNIRSNYTRKKNNLEENEEALLVLDGAPRAPHTLIIYGHNIRL